MLGCADGDEGVGGDERVGGDEEENTSSSPSSPSSPNAYSHLSYGVDDYDPYRGNSFANPPSSDFR